MLGLNPGLRVKLGLGCGLRGEFVSLPRLCMGFPSRKTRIGLSGFETENTARKNKYRIRPILRKIIRFICMLTAMFARAYSV